MTSPDQLVAILVKEEKRQFLKLKANAGEVAQLVRVIKVSVMGCQPVWIAKEV